MQYNRSPTAVDHLVAGRPVAGQYNRFAIDRSRQQSSSSSTNSTVRQWQWNFEIDSFSFIKVHFYIFVEQSATAWRVYLSGDVKPFPGACHEDGHYRTES